VTELRELAEPQPHGYPPAAVPLSQPVTEVNALVVQVGSILYHAVQTERDDNYLVRL